jgi:hypothetical protein
MTDRSQKVEYPHLTWPSSGWWFTVIGALIGLGILLFPSITELALPRRVAIALLLLLIPTFFILIRYISQIASVFCRRANRFDTHLAYMKSLREKLVSAQSTISDLVYERQNRNAYAISYCYCYNDRTYIALRKKRGVNIEEGARVAVVDFKTGSVMGDFRGIKDADDHFLCQKEGYMDALWLGNVRQHGSQHSEAPPEALAIVISSKMGDEND